MMRATVSVTKNSLASTSRAPAARRNAVNGKGGGIRSRTASATAPPFSIFLRAVLRRFVSTYSSSPFSPILRPIQNVSQAPASDPPVASSGTVHASSSSRALRSTTTASIPNGSEKKSVETSAASTTTPSGGAHRAMHHLVKELMAAQQSQKQGGRQTK